MNTMELPLPQQRVELDLAETQARLRQLERRDWWLWGTALVVLLLLTGATLSVSLPLLWAEQDSEIRLGQDLASRGLLGMVLLFGAYSVYQQFQFRRLRTQLAGQAERAARAEGRAEAYQHLSVLDPLTDFFNRRFAEQHLPTEVSRSQRHNYPLTILAVDLNDFKQVNDQHGHAAGDLVLKEFARNLKATIRTSDLPIRMGGDEFLVLFPGCHQEQVPQMISRLKNLETTYDGTRIPIKFAAGWAEYETGELPAELLERADQALYEDKRNSKAQR